MKPKCLKVRALGLLPPADKIDNTVQARSAKRPPANPSINAALLPEMSAQNDRWRRQSPQRSQRPSQAHSRDRSIGGSGYNTPTSKQDADRSSYSGNAWGQKGRGDVQRQAQVQRQSAPPAATPQGYQEQEHAPVNGFNSKEAKVTMKKWYQEANAIGADGKSSLYKPQGDAAPRSAGPWGSKPNTMANGQDFWVQLRKQIAALESSKST
ncbi:hypothetical protein SLS57_002389 [Botryosphaeria dothidea]